MNPKVTYPSSSELETKDICKLDMNSMNSLIFSKDMKEGKDVMRIGDDLFKVMDSRWRRRGRCLGNAMDSRERQGLKGIETSCLVDCHREVQSCE
ncbi:hypothetical protein QJS10_CPB18g01797 [Acorus calamus]|uniref:Uncharacterized protein n=1 Tax=Acorus calamus TaxID=4465 RepID=A0AAV9CJQ1_ACOCL|nr:hypothetical protein QJS10_CPB18g01797 [Acorus calamus]